MANGLTKSSKTFSAVDARLGLPEIQKLKSGALGPDFYARHTCDVARDLLGKVLIVDSRGLTAGRIVETEAYRADDPASHSARGLTPRTAPMFDKPGQAYVYFVYGMYEMLNFVTEPVGAPGAVLIRAVEPLFGHALLARRRRGVRESDWTNGPGRLCRAMAIRMSHNREPLQGPKIWVADDGFGKAERQLPLHVSPRVGITHAADVPWRFFLCGHPHVSRAAQNKLGRPWIGEPTAERPRS